MLYQGKHIVNYTILYTVDLKKLIRTGNKDSLNLVIMQGTQYSVVGNLNML